MTEPSPQSRTARHTEAAFIHRLLTEAGFEGLKGRPLEVFPGREYMIACSSPQAKRKVFGGEVSDPQDGGVIYVDLLLSPDDQEYEVWFWKPMPGELELGLPDFDAFRPD